jgi:hypothetical protein
MIGINVWQTDNEKERKMETKKEIKAGGCIVTHMLNAWLGDGVMNTF